MVGFSEFLTKISQYVSYASDALVQYSTAILQATSEALKTAMYTPLFGQVPFITTWILAGFIFFTLSLRLVPFKLLPHAIDVIRGKYNKSTDIGTFTHMQAVCTAALGTVGLGSISGVAVAIATGGPGAVVWMIIIGLLGVSVKFAEVTMAHKHRVIDPKTGAISGGPFKYLRIAFKGKWAAIGNVMAVFYAVAMVGIAITSANMFQSNQSMVALKDSFPLVKEYSRYFSLGTTAMVAYVTFGGAAFIGRLGAIVTPLMSAFYLLMAAAVIVVNASSVPSAFGVMFSYAFDINAAKWGIVGAMIAGATRSIYTTESGSGTSGMAHAPARTSEPVREGLTAAIEAFIPLFVSVVTGLVIVVTGVYQDNNGFGGVLMTQSAFATVASWFPQALSVSIFFIAITTVMAWSYYGKLLWVELFGSKGIILFQILYILSSYYGMLSQDQGLILQIADCLWLGSTLPNLAALYMMSGDICRETAHYCKRLSDGLFEKAKV